MDDLCHNLMYENGDEFTFIISANETHHEVLPLPSSYGRPTAYIKPTTDLPVLPHGTGRIMRRCIAKQTLNKRDIQREIDEANTTVVWNSESRFVSESPQCYRPLMDVLGVLVRGEMAHPLAVAQPIITYKV